MIAPMFRAESLSVELAGRRLLDGLTLEVTAERAGLVGALDAWFGLLGGGASLVGGTLELAGLDWKEALATGHAAVAQTAVGFSPRFRVEDYLEAGRPWLASQARSRVNARRSLEQLGLGEFRRTPLGGEGSLVRQLAGLTLAMLTEPALLVVAWPLGQLAEQAFARYGAALGRAVHNRCWMAPWYASAPLPAERAWLASLSTVVWVEPSAALQLPSLPEGCLHVLARVTGKPQKLATRLAEQGITSQLLGGNAGLIVTLPRDEQGHPRTDALLASCVELGLGLTGLEPLDGRR